MPTQDASRSRQPIPGDKQACGHLEVLHDVGTDERTGPPKTRLAVYRDARLVGLQQLEKFVDMLRRRQTAIVEIQVLVPDALLQELRPVVGVGLIVGGKMESFVANNSSCGEPSKREDLPC